MSKSPSVYGPIYEVKKLMQAAGWKLRNLGWIRTIFVVLAAILLVTITQITLAQTLVSGDLTGTVTDPSNAVVPNATVTLKNNATGQTQTRTTNAQGFYRFPLLTPGAYTVTITAPSFQSASQTVTVTVGQATTANVQLALGSASQTVEVTAQAPVVQSENGNVSTTFNAAQVSLAPNPGNDLSYIAQSAPGAVMNTQAGYGNFSTFGLPGTSNLFTVNGQNENDPYLNLNNSGATNLLLGNNDVQEATIVNNGYTGQYGGLAGANVNYVTKAGANAWHGNASYWWNGRVMNANNYFNNQSGSPRPFVNDNQWAASIGGPIKKDSTFFFVNTEGLRVLLPTSTETRIPNPQFQAATLANLAAVSPAQIPFYQQIFRLYNGAPGAQNAVNDLPNGGCTSDFTVAGFGAAGSPCAVEFQSTAGNFTHEWLLSGRLDQNIGANDRAFIHFRTDHGVQATYTDPINSVFNAQSTQPQYEGQLNETHTFGANTVNQFILSGSWYSAIFKPADLAAATTLSPFRLNFSGTAFYTLGRNLELWPQGRNVTQYQIVDDVSHTHGRHAFKVGINFRRNDITDFSPGIGTTGNAFNETLTSFFNGIGDNFVQNFPLRLSQPVSLYTLGFYAQDEVRLSNSLKVTLALRGDHNSNPVCQTDCFARLTDPFLLLSHNPALPYNQVIQTGLNQALPGITKVDWQPRFGFAWNPTGRQSTVIRGGFGIFADAFPATVASNFMNNPPLNNQFTVGGGLLAPTLAGSNSQLATAANGAFVNGFNSGGTLASISAANPAFAPPSFFNSWRSIHLPRFQEWNLELQQGLGQKMSFSINYVGNHGIWEPIQNGGLNGFCDLTCQSALAGVPFAGLPATAPDPRFGNVTEVTTEGVSNYNGVTVSLQRKFSNIQLQANYTFSHALDEVSNGGLLPFNFNTNNSVLNPQNPFNIRQYNYGNSDYDVRHYASLNYVINVPQLHGLPSAVFGGWVVSGTLFTRSGYPFTAFDSNATGVLQGSNYNTFLSVNGQVFANYLGGANNSCAGAAVNPATPCLTTATFTPALTGFGAQRRNQFFGPHFFDTDLAVTKNFRIPGWESGRIGVGAQFFNLLNHPNFDQPLADVADPQFGTIISTVNTPTSIYGSFLGGDASPRVIQLNARITF